jgi:G3E family GTPase
MNGCLIMPTSEVPTMSSIFIIGILTQRGGLKIGVLINEVGAIDIDSELVKTKQVGLYHT